MLSKKQIDLEQPLVSSVFELNDILNEYLEDDSVYRNKIKELASRFKSIRKTRGDGNCFFRAFGFSIFEQLIADESGIEKLKKKCQECTEALTKELGYNLFTVDDFKDVFVDEIEKLKNKETTVDNLLESFNDPGISDYIIVFLRLVVSSYLQKNSAFYESFIEGYATIKDFCSHE